MLNNDIIRQMTHEYVHAILRGTPDEMHLVKQQAAQLPQKSREKIVIEILQLPDIETYEVSELLTWFAEFLKIPEDQGAITEAVLDYMRNAKYQNIGELVKLLNVLQNHSQYLPFDDDDNNIFNGRNKFSYLKEFCTILVHTLMNFNFSHEPQNVTQTKECVMLIENFLRHLMNKAHDKLQFIFICLKTLYNIISDPNQKQGPGMALVVLRLVDEKQFSKISSNFVAQEHNDVHLASALKVLCSSLPCWPEIDLWVKQLIQSFEDRQKYKILNEFAEEELPKMMFFLYMPALRSNCSEVIFYILKRQATPSLLNKLDDKILKAYEFLKQENSDNARECLQNLVDVVAALVLRFSDKVANKLLSSFPIPPRQSVVNEILNEFVWAEEGNEIIDCIIFLKPMGEDGGKTHNGKVGLTNLGNTCYMNSVLQALVMTRQFCYEVLNYSPPCETGEKSVLKKLRNLFALLIYSQRKTWAPTEILQACRPAYFIAGQQQDSSEFLCHLLDVLHEQEKSTNIQYSNCDPMISSELKIEEKDCEITPVSECEPMESVSNIKRWTTEENLSEGGVLERKTQSLADFTNGDDLSQTQNLSDSHSDSTDSGIQSVGGEDMSQVSLVHRVFGGQMNITYQCIQCNTSSHNTDKFRDLQLCFPEEISENHEVSVQDLINYYLVPENLTGDNKYRCDKCTKLCDAQRIIKILQAPSHLILTLKHFRYDSETRLRTKLRHKVAYNEVIQLEICTPSGKVTEEYHLYAAVVHSGYSMDYGHYFTYARDSKHDWYKFNDSFVSRTTLQDFKRLEPPDTPYILFYGKAGYADALGDDDKPELLSLSKSVQDLVNDDMANYSEELKQEGRRKTNAFLKLRKDNNPDDDNPPSSTCRGPINMPNNTFLC